MGGNEELGVIRPKARKKKANGSVNPVKPAAARVKRKLTTRRARA